MKDLPLSARTLERLVHPRTVYALIAAYVIIHYLLRLLVSPTLTPDEAEQVQLIQQLDWGFRFRQPPLYTWIVWAVDQVFGHSLAVLAALKYLLLGLGLAAIYETARHFLRDRALAALALFAYALIYGYAWHVHMDLTHTILMIVMVALTVWLAGRIERFGLTRDYVLLGLVIGLGVLSKYIYITVVIEIALAALIVPSFRRAIYDRRILISAILALALLVAPGVWIVEHSYSFVSLASRVTWVGAEKPHFLGDFKGVWELISATLQFPAPFWIIAVPLLPALFRRRPEAGPARDPDRRFLGWMLIAGVLVTLAVIVVLGTTEFKTRWLHAALLTVPIYLFSRTTLETLKRQRLGLYLATVAIVTLGVMGGRVALTELHPPVCKTCRDYIDFEALAEVLREDGFETGTIVTSDMHIAGNLMIHFPEARAVYVLEPPFLWPDEGPGGGCLAVYRPNLVRRDYARQIQPYVLEHYGADLDRAEPRDVEVPLNSGGDRTVPFTYRLLPGGAGECR